MRNPALPAPAREVVTDIDPLMCPGCQRVIFSTALCVWVRSKLWCGEACANTHALKKLRSYGRALPY